MPHHNIHESKLAPMPITKGMEVYSADDQKVGVVIEVATEYIHVSKSSLFTNDLYIPRIAIGGVDGRRILLHLASDEIARRPWAQPPQRPIGTNPLEAFSAGGQASGPTERRKMGREGEPPQAYREEEPMIGTYPKIEDEESDEERRGEYGRSSGDRDW